MSKLKDSWGLYPWFVEDGEHLVCPSDVEDLKKLSPYGKVFKCIDEVDEYLVLQYGKETFRVKPGLYKTVDKPLFEIGCIVKLVKDISQIGTIEEINWHYKDNSPMYFIRVNGKRKSTRYSEEDLKTL